MCGRYYVDMDTVRELRRLVGDIDWRIKGRVDIHPSERAYVLCKKEGRFSAAWMEWGFPNAYAKGLLINARSETALLRPAFRESVLRRRCVILAKGFYEWNRAGEKVEFHRENNLPLYMAGCWQWVGEAPRFVILTTGANASVERVHDRMPLILKPKEAESWIFEDERTEEVLTRVPPLLEKEQEYEQQTLDFLDLMR